MPTPSPSPAARTVHTPPDPARPDAAVAVVSEFVVGSEADQQRLFAASRAAWDTLPWPDTLLSITWLAGTDGRHALAYAQWRDDSEFEAFGRTHRPVLAARLGEAVPGMEVVPPVRYRHYRSLTRPDAAAPGCVVVVSVEFDGPDEGRARTWVDTVFDALEAEPSPPPGGISGHFHVSLDGTRALNYAEWVDEAAHAAALDRSGGRAVGVGPKWRDVHAFPGVKAGRVTRYRLDRRLEPATAPE